MKFSERSKKGKRRLLTVGGIFLGVVVGGWLFVMYSKNDFTKQLSKTYDELYKDEARGEVVMAPTMEPQVGDDLVEDNVEYVYKYNAEDLQRELLSLVENENYSYGAAYRQDAITKQGLVPAFYEELGREISLDKVGIGDVGIGPNYTGICVGFNKGKPIFAYAAEKTLYRRFYTGVCIGNVLFLADETFCGMYPVELTVFYDCCNTMGDDTLLQEKEEKLRQKQCWYGDLLYEYGRMMSQKDVGGLINLMPEGPMHQCNVEILPEEFMKFLERFAKQQGCPGEKYSLYVTDEISNGVTLASLRVALVSLEEGNYLETYGDWYVTMYQSNEFFPCGADLNSYIEVCGFVQDKKIVVNEDEEGNITVEKEELVYGYTTDENGRPIIRAADGSVLYLDTKRPIED